MPRLIAHAANVGIDLLPHVSRLSTDDVFRAVVDCAIEEAFRLKEEDADDAARRLGL